MEVAINGVTVPVGIVTGTIPLTAAMIAAEPNVERRRVYIELFGLDRLVRELRGRLVDDSPRFGRLIHLDLGSGEPLAAIEVEDATPLPDGTRKRYVLRVPPTCRTAHEAVAWTFGLTPEQYQPAVET